MRRFARGVSILLHPLFMPLYTLALAMAVDPHLVYFLPVQARWITLGMVAVMTVAFPMTSTLLLLRAGMITGLEMPTRMERITPFAMTVLYYGMTYYLLRQSPLHPAAIAIFAGFTATALLCTLITYWWKISVHMVGIGALIGAIFGLSAVHGLQILPVIAILILFAGLLGSARLIAGTHVHAQIYAGLALGAFVTYSFVVLGWVV